MKIAGREGLRDGTTAVVALLEEGTLTVAHVGDSRAVLCKAGGTSHSITADHKPELPDEKRRIEALGGFVSYIGCWRAMGILAMSRAIGDLFLKPYVTAEPDVVAVPLGQTDEFFVLASDGVFDVFDNEQVVRICRSASTPQDAADLLTNSAYIAGSLDNVTAIVVALRGYKNGVRAMHPSPAEPFSRAPKLDDSTYGHTRLRGMFCDSGALQSRVGAGGGSAFSGCVAESAMCGGGVGDSGEDDAAQRFFGWPGGACSITTLGPLAEVPARQHACEMYESAAMVW